jgi:CP family cyanate transporter-like MFS transporter
MGLMIPGRRVHPALLALAVSVLALNLRLTMVSLPPLLPAIQRNLRLSGAAAGVLTALPVLCMALFAPGAHRLAHRVGREATTLGSVALVAVGNGLRLLGGPVALFGGTLLAGVGIAACGVVLPGMVKEYFPRRAGAATGAYLVSMMLGAAAAPALAVPLAHALGSWEASLGSWALPGLLAVAAWIPLARRLNAPEASASSEQAGGLPWRSRGAWLLAGFLSLQAALGYAYLAWIAPAYEARGWSDDTAGALLATMNFAQLASALVLPARSRDRRPALVAAVACTVLGAVVLFAAPDAAPWVACAVVGLGLGGGFSLGLVLVVDYAANPAASSRLAAMTFLVCYTTAAVAPVLVGALHDATGSYSAAFAVLAAMALAQLVMATSLGPAHRTSVR